MRALSALAAGVLAVAVVAALVIELRPGAGDGTLVEGRDPSVFQGLGAWVDVYDYGPAYLRPQEGPAVAPDEVDRMAERGVRTLFLQAARLDDRSPRGIVDAGLVGRFLERAHERGMRVVGWYLPKFGDLEADLRNLRLIRDFERDGHRFDAIGVDIEWRRDVPDHAERNRRLVELSRRLRREAEGQALGAIVYPPVTLESVYPGYWPDFPWPELAGLYDAWLPMAYWTEATAQSGYREGYRYTADSIRLLRERLGRPAVPVHPVGGVAGATKLEDYQGFVRAAQETGAVGISIYDYRTTGPLGWGVLRRASSNPPISST